jgi:hypothetical protein
LKLYPNNTPSSSRSTGRLLYIFTIHVTYVRFSTASSSLKPTTSSKPTAMPSQLELYAPQNEKRLSNYSVQVLLAQTRTRDSVEHIEVGNYDSECIAVRVGLSGRASMQHLGLCARHSIRASEFHPKSSPRYSKSAALCGRKNVLRFAYISASIASYAVFARQPVFLSHCGYNSFILRQAAKGIKRIAVIRLRVTSYTNRIRVRTIL